MLIGLTGGIGSGKSTVSNLFRKYGIPIIDADLIAREVVEPGKKAWKAIIDHFGEEILLPDQHINRKKLGNLIFQNKEKRMELNEITHPIILAEILTRAEELQKHHQQVIVDIPLLFESKREPLFDQIIVVYVNKSIQLQRLMARDQISKEEALQKINAQMSLESKKEKADIVIYNDQDLSKTEQQVLTIIRQWKKGMDK